MAGSCGASEAGLNESEVLFCPAYHLWTDVGEEPSTKV